MKATTLAVCAALALLVLQPATAQVARPSDKAVVKLIEKAQESVEDFRKRLDPDVRKGTIRGASAEVDVERYFDDLEVDFERLGKRFKPDYSASAEALAVLVKTNGIDRFMKSQSAAMKGRSEWDVAAVALNELAAAYGTAFPASGEPTARRVNDGEIEQASSDLVKHAQSYRKGLKAGFTKEEEAALKAVQSDVDALADAAKNLKSRVGSGKPASGEAGVVLERHAAVSKGMAGRSPAESATEAWIGIEKSVATIERAFGVAPSAD